jgi:hypothetical protein
MFRRRRRGRSINVILCYHKRDGEGNYTGTGMQQERYDAMLEARYGRY